jgi:hypothetical protein
VGGLWRGGKRTADPLGYARDDKKLRAVVKGRAVAKGEGGCWGRKKVFPW